jgi:mono/diheme cytochrome c family protein
VVSSSVSLSVSAEAAAQLAELTGEAAQGRQLFLLNCAHCHGDVAHGDEGRYLHKSDARIHEVITAGTQRRDANFLERSSAIPDVPQLIAYPRALQG